MLASQSRLLLSSRVVAPYADSSLSEMKMRIDHALPLSSFRVAAFYRDHFIGIRKGKGKRDSFAAASRCGCSKRQEITRGFEMKNRIGARSTIFFCIRLAIRWRYF